MSRYSSYRSSKTKTTAPDNHLIKIHKSWWKSPAIIAAGILGVAVVGVTLMTEFTTQRVIHIRADDASDSAVEYAAERQQHCQASVQHAKPGDKVITIPFADRPVTTQNISVFNSLSLLGSCQDNHHPIKSKQSGTSLILLLERIKSIVQKERARNNHNPVVVTISIQDDEPGPNQPAPNNIKRVKTLIHSLTVGKGAIALVVKDEELQNQLDTNLASERNLQICSFQEVASCINWAFETGRQLHN